MSDIYSKLKAYDHLLSNWHNKKSPNMSPSEYAKYRDMALQTHAGGKTRENLSL